LEETNDAYAIAKIAGIKMCESYNSQYKRNYKCIMPTNTFGPNDNYDNLNSHFFPALIKKTHNIKTKNKNELILWGNGLAKREVVYVDDIADACIYFMKNKIKENIVNIGTGVDFTVNDYAKKILKLIIPNKKILIKYDTKKPNGTPRKVLDINLAKSYGWTPKTKLSDAILKTYLDFLKVKK
jgi:GDP-L-fucose synthase